MILRHDDNSRWYTFATFEALPGVRTFVTTRRGAVEGAPYSTDNMGEHTGDDPQRVGDARCRLCQSLNLLRLITPHQTHGVEILAITDEFLQLSDVERQARLEGVDAVITSLSGVAIAVSTADCVPLVMYDAEQKVCAAVHAGWRGMAAHIILRVIEALTIQYGVDPTRLQVGVGPSIGPDSFEVGDEVVDTFRDAGFDIGAIARRYPSGRYHVDLWAAAVEELERGGVDLSRIEVAGVCTRTHSDEFFSARALGIHSGRFLTGIALLA